MALHILQPGLRPIGQFDLKTTTGTNATVTGGEIGLLEAAASTDEAAADVANVGPITALGSTPVPITVALGAPSTDTDLGTAGGGMYLNGMRFLLDEGTDEYGTLFGTMIGGAAGQGVRYGVTNEGSVVAVGPSTALASGKVTCWHAPGLYAVSGTGTGAVAEGIKTADVNEAIFATSAGLLSTAENGDVVAVGVGGMYDQSLVSTTLAAAGETAAATKFAIYFLGQR